MEMHLLQVALCLAAVVAPTVALFDIEHDQIDGNANFKVIEIDNGFIRGKKEVTLFEKKAYYAFKGIPYGRAPIGELRFKPPQKAQPWQGTLDVFEFGNECVQPSVTLEWKGDEDCLFLNVYAPAEKPLKPLAVIMYIHFGAFYSGSGNIYGPDFLIDNNVIVVTINYRVGPFGFLSLGIPEYSGNMGLKDQALALKWVHENIVRFGGDRDRVTLFGTSAGAASVSYLITSPVTKHLFQRAILSSGCMLNTWASTEDNHTSILEQFGKHIFSPVSGTAELIKLLHSVDAELLSKHTFQNLITEPHVRRVSGFIWAPVVEHPDAIEPILSKSPTAILQDIDFTENKDILIGHTSDEAYVLLIKEMLVPSKINYTRDFEIGLPLTSAKIPFNSGEFAEICDEVRSFYLGNLSANGNRSDMYRGVNNIMTDNFFVYGINHMAKIYADKSSGNVFFYRFSADTGLNTFKRFSTARMYGLSGATHSDEMFYVHRVHGQLPFLDATYTLLKEDSLERQLITNFTRLITNFAKYGAPTQRTDSFDFKAMTTDQFNYLEITNNGFEMKIDPSRERIEFWDHILTKYSYAWQQRDEPIKSLDLNTFGIVVLSIVAIVILVLVLKNALQHATYFIKLQDLLTI